MTEKIYKNTNGFDVELTEAEYQEFYASQQFSESDEEKLRRFKLQAVNSRESYLKKTAEYYMPDFPPDILEKRALAREEINEIEVIISISETESYSINFS